ncbi:hypothetical protein J6590_075950 [Homalodisca vitripennis]|nr:hypothetical protein J6590_075950 [Homalodisca vitripennis]
MAVAGPGTLYWRTYRISSQIVNQKSFRCEQVTLKLGGHPNNRSSIDRSQSRYSTPHATAALQTRLGASVFIPSDYRLYDMPLAEHRSPIFLDVLTGYA